jgi:hypothetical protein
MLLIGMIEELLKVSIGNLIKEEMVGNYEKV